MRSFDRFLDNLDPVDRERLFVKLIEKSSLTDLQQAREGRTNFSKLGDHIEEAEKRFAQWGQLQGLSSGYLSVDEMTKGLVGGELVVISGHTSHGKTQLAINVAYRVAKRKIPVLFVTLEMTKVELTTRFMKIAEPKPIGDLPVLYQEATNLNYQDINLMVRKAKEQGVKLVIIDHLHYFVRSIEFSSQEIGRIVKEFKEAAVINDIPIVLISHVRKLANNKRPSIEDLRDSSFIGQDADVVLMVWRDLKPDSTSQDKMELLVLKNRNRGLFTNQRRRYLYSEGALLTEKAPKEEEETSDGKAAAAGEKEEEDIAVELWKDS